MKRIDLELNFKLTRSDVALINHKKNPYYKYGINTSLNLHRPLDFPSGYPRWTMSVWHEKNYIEVFDEYLKHSIKTI